MTDAGIRTPPRVLSWHRPHGATVRYTMHRLNNYVRAKKGG